VQPDVCQFTTRHRGKFVQRSGISCICFPSFCGALTHIVDSRKETAEGMRRKNVLKCHVFRLSVCWRNSIRHVRVSVGVCPTVVFPSRKRLAGHPVYADEWPSRRFLENTSRRRAKPDLTSRETYSLRMRCAWAMNLSTSVCFGVSKDACLVMVSSFMSRGIIAAPVTCGLCWQNANHSRHALSTWLSDVRCAE